MLSERSARTAERQVNDSCPIRLDAVTDRYPTPQFRRTALAPGILGALVLIATVGITAPDGLTIVRYAVSILALIVVVFAWQAKQWWWSAVLAGVAVLFNPVLPIEFERDILLGIHYGSALAFIGAAILVKIRNTEDRNSR
jgi:hypothetical protein